MDRAEDLARASMLPVPGGVVDLRDDRLGTRWQVDVEPFELGRYPVTVDLHSVATGGDDASSEAGTRPVTNLTWLDAVDVCNRLSVLCGLRPAYTLPQAGAAPEGVVWDRGSDGFRLPTEAEWQHACQAGAGGYRYGELDEIAWYADNSGGRRHSVGGKAPNDWKLSDMLGNVWEWCWDVYDEQEYGAYRIFRGGGWAEPARGCGATVRRRSHPTFSIDDLGMRLARSVG